MYICNIINQTNTNIMAVYREGYHIIENLLSNSNVVKIPCNTNDEKYKDMVQLVNDYGNQKTRKTEKLPNGDVKVSIEVKLIDEWAVSDERKTITEATDLFIIVYTKYRNTNQKYDGHISVIQKIKM